MLRALPNLISGLRFALAPVLAVLAFGGHRTWFLGILTFSLLTDAADGFLARHYRLTNRLGPILDSAADLAIYSAFLLGGLLLWPEAAFLVRYAIAAIAAAYLLAAGACLVKFRHLPNYHTWAAKTAAVLVSIAALALFLTGNPWPFRAAAAFQVLVLLENFAITLVLPRMRYDVPSLAHALRSRRDRAIPREVR